MLAYVLNVPWILSGSWALISAFLPEDAQRKVTFVSSLDSIEELNLSQISSGIMNFC